MSVCQPRSHIVTLTDGTYGSCLGLSVDEYERRRLVRSLGRDQSLHVHLITEDLSACTIIYITSTDHEVRANSRDFAITSIARSETLRECRGSSD